MSTLVDTYHVCLLPRSVCQERYPADVSIVLFVLSWRVSSETQSLRIHCAPPVGATRPTPRGGSVRISWANTLVSKFIVHCSMLSGRCLFHTVYLPSTDHLSLYWFGGSITHVIDKFQFRLQANNDARLKQHHDYIAYSSWLLTAQYLLQLYH